MHLLTIMLPLGWVVCHVLMLLIVKDKKLARPTLILIGLLLLLIFLIKPYTYDLNKYSIFFNTGYIQTLNWGWHEVGHPIDLDPADMTGEPFGDGFEIGFRKLAHVGAIFLPLGQLIPRLDVDFVDFEQRTPRADAIVYVIGIIGFLLLYASTRFMVFADGVPEKKIDWSPLLAGPAVLGSVFFLMGSQNSLRQFLAISILILAVSCLQNKRFYFVSAILIVLSGGFHKWAPMIGIILAIISVLGKCDDVCPARSEIRPFRITRSELLSFLFGLILVVLGKIIIMSGVVHWNLPLIADLKTYIISDLQFSSAERVSALIKVIAIIIAIGISELLFGNTSRTNYLDTRALRRRTFLFVLPFIIYPEVFSRLLMMYWAIEVFILVSGLSSREVRMRAGAASIFLFYGLAPNAFNILIGSQWIHQF